ncbi:hypothetical protein JHK82_019780 [Glycine max]|nr:hypothetical protein JHK85_020228 [Glycine max]KAG5038958.1 hypothetical protein JHK86_019798 [Glycine max]KAG5144085.1 hypothetical protein JHK82_019780 [Glycine max]
MSVMVLDPSLREYNMCFKKWETERSYVYNLTRGWNQILHHNDLKLVRNSMMNHDTNDDQVVDCVSGGGTVGEVRDEL